MEAVGMRSVVEDSGDGVSGRGRGCYCGGHRGRFIFGGLTWAEPPGMRSSQLKRGISINLALGINIPRSNVTVDDEELCSGRELCRDG